MLQAVLAGAAALHVQALLPAVRLLLRALPCSMLGCNSERQAVVAGHHGGRRRRSPLTCSSHGRPPLTNTHSPSFLDPTPSNLLHRPLPCLQPGAVGPNNADAPGQKSDERLENGPAPQALTSSPPSSPSPTTPTPTSAANIVGPSQSPPDPNPEDNALRGSEGAAQAEAECCARVLVEVAAAEAALQVTLAGHILPGGMRFPLAGWPGDHLPMGP